MEVVALTVPWRNGWVSDPLRPSNKQARTRNPLFKGPSVSFLLVVHASLISPLTSVLLPSLPSIQSIYAFTIRTCRICTSSWSLFHFILPHISLLCLSVSQSPSLLSLSLLSPPSLVSRLPLVSVNPWTRLVSTVSISMYDPLVVVVVTMFY